MGGDSNRQLRCEEDDRVGDLAPSLFDDLFLAFRFLQVPFLEDRLSERSLSVMRRFLVAELDSKTNGRHELSNRTSFIRNLD